MNAALLLLLCLFLTLIIEEALLLPARSPRLHYACLLANLLTNPALNLLLIAVSRRLPLLFWPALLLLELAAVAAETWAYRSVTGWPRRRAFLLSLGLNAASFVLGALILRGIFHA